MRLVQIFSSWFTNPPTVIFRKVEKILNFFYLSADSDYYLTQTIICIVENNNIFLRVGLCILE